jgi:hypothetical protein
MDSLQLARNPFLGIKVGALFGIVEHILTHVLVLSIGGGWSPAAIRASFKVFCHRGFLSVLLLWQSGAKEVLNIALNAGSEPRISRETF